MSEFKDYYASLGVPRDAPAEDIKKSFRKLARLYHPDVAKDKATAGEKFKEINEAYEVLGDPEKRRKYDTLGPDWNSRASAAPPSGGRPGGGPSNSQEFRFGGTGFSSFFEEMFGHANGFENARTGNRSRRGPGSAAQRGEDIEGDLLVTLDEVLRGSIRSISLETVDPRTGQTGTETFKVRIPTGVHEGQVIRVSGKGGKGIGGGAPGDLLLRVRLAAHPDFRFQGSDVFHDLDLAPWEAVLGCTVDVPTPSGSVSVRIPAGTGRGRQLRVRGHGLPAGADGVKGDLYVTVDVVLPSDLTDAEKGLWESLRDGSRFQPRPRT